MNPNGVYLKHINLRVILKGFSSHPDYDYIKQHHPEWVIKDRYGKPIPLFGWGEVLDFGNDAFIDWALNTWMPNQYLDDTDRDLNRVTWYVHDNGDLDECSWIVRPMTQSAIATTRMKACERHGRISSSTSRPATRTRGWS